MSSLFFVIRKLQHLQEEVTRDLKVIQDAVTAANVQPVLAQAPATEEVTQQTQAVLSAYVEAYKRKYTDMGNVQTPEQVISYLDTQLEHFNKAISKLQYPHCYVLTHDTWNEDKVLETKEEVEDAIKEHSEGQNLSYEELGDEAEAYHIRPVFDFPFGVDLERKVKNIEAIKDGYSATKEYAVGKSGQEPDVFTRYSEAVDYAKELIDEGEDPSDIYFCEREVEEYNISVGEYELEVDINW